MFTLNKRLAQLHRQIQINEGDLALSKFVETVSPDIMNGELFDFVGCNCDDYDCQWDGLSRRCNCGNRRVDWNWYPVGFCWQAEAY